MATTRDDRPWYKRWWLDFGALGVAVTVAVSMRITASAQGARDQRVDDDLLRHEHQLEIQRSRLDRVDEALRDVPVIRQRVEDIVDYWQVPRHKDRQK